MSVFGTETNIAQTTVDQLVGEGKKYATVDELAKAYTNADAFIENLKRESGELRAELQTRLSVEEQLNRLQTQQRDDEPISTPPVQQPQAPAQESGINQENLAELIRNELNQSKEQERLRSNVEQVARRVTEVYGSEEKANEVITAKAQELGVSVEFLQDVASRSPKAFYAQIGLDAPQSQTPQPTSGNVNPAIVAINSNAQVKPNTYAWYQNLRRDNPTEYFTPAVQNAIMRDAETARQRGEDFYAGAA